MDEERSTTDRAGLDDLVQRARTELRDWTDQTDRDPGIALLELFAYVGELLSRYADRVADEAHLDTGRARPGRRERLALEVDGHRWCQVADLADSDADDQHYVVGRRADGASVVEFGDGVHGRRPPAGSSIGVRYRHAGRYSSVLVQEGRVVVDAEWTEESWEDDSPPTCP